MCYRGIVIIPNQAFETQGISDIGFVSFFGVVIEKNPNIGRLRSMSLRLFGCLYSVLQGHGADGGKESFKNDGTKCGITNVKIS